MQRVESETDAGLLGFAGNLRQDGDRKRRRPQPSHDVASGPVGVLHGHNAISTPRKVHPLAMSNQSPSGPDSFRIPRPKARGRVSSSPYPPRRRGSSRSAAAGAAAVAGAGGQSDMGTMFFVFLPSLAGQVDHHGHGLVGAADLGGSPDVPSTPMVFTPRTRSGCSISVFAAACTAFQVFQAPRGVGRSRKPWCRRGAAPRPPSPQPGC